MVKNHKNRGKYKTLLNLGKKGFDNPYTHLKGVIFFHKMSYLIIFLNLIYNLHLMDDKDKKVERQPDLTAPNRDVVA